MNTETKSPNAPTHETVMSVQHYTDRLFKFRITRPDGFRFRSGEFVMIGLETDAKPILRAYSMASPHYDEGLDFYSIKVQDGPLTSRLQNIQPGDTVLLGRKPTGTLVLDALLAGKRLYMISTGTGVAPFASLVRDPETYERFEQVILTHTCRETGELTFGDDTIAAAKDDPLVGEDAQQKLRLVKSLTRDAPGPGVLQGRMTTLIESGALFDALGAPPLNPETDRVMLCGSMAFIDDMKVLLQARGFDEGSNAAPSTFVVERAFVG